MQLETIHWPVYLIGTEQPIQEDDMLYIEVSHRDEEDTEILIIDDKSVPGDSLAMRRLHLANRGAVLKNLKVALFFVADLVKFSDPTKWFVDSSGQHFRYTKTKLYPLVCRKITKIKDIPTGGALIEVEGFANRFKILHSPDPSNTYAGLILIGHSAVLYGLYPGAFENTRRKV